MIAQTLRSAVTVSPPAAGEKLELEKRLAEVEAAQVQEFVKTDDHLGVVQSRDELNAELLSTQVRGVMEGAIGGGVGYRVQGL